MSAQTGSMMNYLMMNSETVTPEIGGPATLLMWTDRYPMTITGLEFFKSGPKAGLVKAVLAREDFSTRVDENGMSTLQQYTFTENVNAREKRFALKKDGSLRGDYGTLVVGFKSKYHDFSF